MRKLDLKHHKLILPLILLVLLLIAIFFGSGLAAYDQNVPVILIMIFALVLLTLVLALLNFSILVRSRDENHSMHEENKQHVRILHEKMKQVHNHLLKK